MAMTNISKNRIAELMLQFIPVNQRGARRRICMITVIQFILHKLKTGCQWRLLYADIEGVRPPFSWQTVYRYFRIWVQSGAWQQLFYALRNNNLNKTQLSVLNLDGTQTIAKRGGECVGYQQRKRATTSNLLILTDGQGLPLSFGLIQSGSHHDQFRLCEQFGQMYHTIKKWLPRKAAGCWLNADKGFDSKKFRDYLKYLNIQPNIPEKVRKGSKNHGEPKTILNKEIYQQRFTCERTFAWFDSFRTVLIRFDRLTECWLAWHYMAAFLMYLNC